MADQQPLAEWRAGRITLATFTVVVLVMNVALPLTLWESGAILENLVVSAVFASLGVVYWWLLAGRLKASVYPDRVEVQNAFLRYRVPMSTIVEVFCDGRYVCMSLQGNRSVSVTAIPYRERGVLKGLLYRRGHEFALIVEGLRDAVLADLPPGVDRSTDDKTKQVFLESVPFLVGTTMVGSVMLGTLTGNVWIGAGAFVVLSGFDLYILWQRRIREAQG